jgi:hypothetical protein
MAALGLILGAIAFVYAWSWAGRSGPIHRLTSRACGVALGYLVPAAIISHALYFQWVRCKPFAEMDCCVRSDSFRTDLSS